MQNFKTLKCCHCRSVVLNLPETEVIKLDGLTFLCECCGHKNTLENLNFSRCKQSESSLNIFALETSPI